MRPRRHGSDGRTRRRPALRTAGAALSLALSAAPSAVATADPPPAPAGPAQPGTSRTPPAPLFRDPVHDGAADPTLVWNREEKRWWILYTNRRADADDEKGVKWVHGSDIGLASTSDGGLTWIYRGVARGLDIAGDGSHNTFWAPEVVFDGGKYHAFVSYVRGVPETWEGTRDILHYTSPNLLDWTFERNVVPGSIDACVHRLPDGRWRMWFKNEQGKIRGTVRDSDDLTTWRPSRSEMPDPRPGQGEGPDVIFWKGSFWMVKDTWKGLRVYRSADADQWETQGLILDRPGRRTGDEAVGSHAGLVAIDEETAYIFYFVHQPGPELASRHTWLQVARLGYDGRTLTCDRNADFDFVLREPRPGLQPEHPPALPRR
ncbi:MAG: glycosyl hydrolase [Holophagales bacterium]|nr:glycosyl hydrolase [Holophagales bacterium]